MEGARSSGSLYWMLQLGGWTAFAVVMSLSRIGLFPLDYMVATKGSLAVLGFLVSLLLRELYKRLDAREMSVVGLVLLTGTASYVAALVWTVPYNVGLSLWGDFYDGRALMPGDRPLLLSGSVYHAFVLMAWSVLYFGIRHIQDLAVERKRSLRAEAMARDAELRALRYQLNPHFFFNTLNAVSTLVAEERGDAARRMIARLGDFMRLTLEDDGAALIPLARELDYVRHYLEIEQIRFGSRLQMDIEADSDVLTSLVPNLIMQPLVENAVVHGIAPVEAGGTIRVRARSDGDRLVIVVSNTAPVGRESEERRGIGLSNVRRRLEHTYTGDFRMTTHFSGAEAEVVIDLPDS